MRVLHVHSGNMFGGVETLMLTLAANRDAAPEMEPHFALCFRDRLARELEAAGAPVRDLGEVRISRPHQVIRARRRLARLLRELRPDVVLCHSPWSLAVFGPTVRRAGAPLAMTMHGAAEGHWLERLAWRTPPDLVLANSEYTISTLTALPPNVRVELVYYPIASRAVELDQDARAAVRAELDTPAEAVVIVQVSRMEPWKGHRLHLDALARMRDVPGWVCWQVGGAQRPEERVYMDGLREQAERAGIADRVRFLGLRSDVPRLLAAADVHCQPNTGPEPFGITFIEGLDAGLPVVTTAIGGGKEIVDPSCGILVPPADPGALAAALADLVRSPEKRARLGAAGPARAEALCGVETQLPRLARALASIVSPGTV